MEDVLSQRYQKKKKPLFSFSPFFYLQGIYFLYCLNKFAGRSNAYISQAASVTVVVVEMVCVIIMPC